MTRTSSMVRCSWTIVILASLALAGCIDPSSKRIVTASRTATAAQAGVRPEERPAAPERRGPTAVDRR